MESEEIMQMERGIVLIQAEYYRQLLQIEFLSALPLPGRNILVLGMSKHAFSKDTRITQESKGLKIGEAACGSPPIPDRTCL